MERKNSIGMTLLGVSILLLVLAFTGLGNGLYLFMQRGFGGGVVTPTTPPSGTIAPPTGGYIAGNFNPKFQVLFPNGTAVASGQTVSFFVPNAAKDYWTTVAQSIKVDSSGYVTGPVFKEGQIFLAKIMYNSTTKIQDQYKEMSMPYKATDWTQSYLYLDPLICKISVSANTKLLMYIQTSNSSTLSTNASAATQISKGQAGYPKVTDAMKLIVKLNEADRQYGGEYKQYATDQGTTQKTTNSYLVIGVNGTSKFIMPADWSQISGPTTTKNVTKLVPELTSGDSIPTELTVTYTINWSGCSTNAVYQVWAMWIDSQVLSDLLNAGTTSRNVNEMGSMTSKTSYGYVKIVA